MKAEPTALDREAATLFTPAPGMRVFNADAGWGRLAEAAWAGTTLTHWSTDSLAVAGHTRVDAIDTDDPATVGVMLAQVKEAADGTSVSVHDRLNQRTITGWPVTRFAVYVGNESHTVLAKSGQALGAALVAAMRALKSAPTR